MNSKKIVVIGAGNVGSTTAFRLLQTGLYNDIVLIDTNTDKAEGEAEDIVQGSRFAGYPARVYAGSYEKDLADAGIIIITAGATSKPGESRLNLVQRSTAIFKSIVPQIKQSGFDGFIIVVANPVDILTYVTYKLSGLPRERVIGSGTVLDSSRLVYYLSEKFQVNMNSVEAKIIGEHGDSSVPVWSEANITGIPLDKYAQLAGIEFGEAEKKEIHSQARDSGYDIVAKKGMTNYGVAMCTTRIATALTKDEHSILPVSTVMQGEYGLNDVALSVPSFVSAKGAEALQVELSQTEQAGLENSAHILSDIIKGLEI